MVQGAWFKTGEMRVCRRGAPPRAVRFYNATRRRVYLQTPDCNVASFIATYLPALSGGETGFQPVFCKSQRQVKPVSPVRQTQDCNPVLNHAGKRMFLRFLRLFAAIMFVAFVFPVIGSGN